MYRDPQEEVVGQFGTVAEDGDLSLGTEALDQSLGVPTDASLSKRNEERLGSRG